MWMWSTEHLPLYPFMICSILASKPRFIEMLVASCSKFWAPTLNGYECCTRGQYCKTRKCLDANRQDLLWAILCSKTFCKHLMLWFSLHKTYLFWPIAKGWCFEVSCFTNTCIVIIMNFECFTNATLNIHHYFFVRLWSDNHGWSLQEGTHLCYRQRLQWNHRGASLQRDEEWLHCLQHRPFRLWDWSGLAEYQCQEGHHQTTG